MTTPFLRSLQWLGVAAVLFAVVGLTYDFNSEAGKTMNAPVEDALSQGLLGYWKMDEGTGTSTTVDSSGNANNLTMTAMESGDWVAGQIGGYSLDFDGSAEWLTISDPASGILDVTDGRDFTLTGWFNRDTFTTDDTVVAKRNGIANTDDGYILYIDDATDQLILEVSEAGGTDEYQVASTSTFTATGWNHFAAVWDDGNATQTEIYINGKADNGTDTGTIANLGNLSNAVAFDIGAESDNGNPFDGKIDDVRIYGSALPANEISRLYQTTVPGNPADTGLVGHWTFDGNDVNWSDTGLEIKDVSGKGNHGAVSGLTRTSVTPGKLGQGLSFNGTSNGINTTFVPGAQTMTISFWMNVNNTNNTYYPVSISQESQAKNWYLRVLDANSSPAPIEIWYVPSDGNDLYVTTVTAPIIAGNWYYVVVVTEITSGNNGTFILYINASTVPLDDSTFTDWVPTGNPVFTIGVDRLGYFKGMIDDVRFYNRALSSTEVTNLYNFGK